jgi:hypothetical protein
MSEDVFIDMLEDDEQPPDEGLDATTCSAGWLPIDSAPKDGTEIIVYCPPAHGLNHMASVCAWHEDAGFCVDELREPSLWIPLPNNPAQPQK